MAITVNEMAGGNILQVVDAERSVVGRMVCLDIKSLRVYNGLHGSIIVLRCYLGGTPNPQADGKRSLPA